MIEFLHGAAYSLVALVLLSWGGNLVCRWLLRLTGLKPAAAEAPEPAEEETDTARAGRVIGSLERLIMAGGVLITRWEILAAVIALKSVSRFKELNDKTFAEYFLVGSLCSLLWTILVALAWLGYDATLGVGLRETLLDLLGISRG
jgi:hypothetical protein